jgi:hypothetical protein
MVLSVVAYAWVFGWWYAVGFVGLLFVHEVGHYVAARQRGLAARRRSWWRCCSTARARHC